jgi:hypothetical protein
MNDWNYSNSKRELKSSLRCLCVFLEGMTELVVVSYSASTVRLEMTPPSVGIGSEQTPTGRLYHKRLTAETEKIKPCIPPVGRLFGLKYRLRHKYMHQETPAVLPLGCLDGVCVCVCVCVCALAYGFLLKLIWAYISQSLSRTERQQSLVQRHYDLGSGSNGNTRDETRKTTIDG